MRRPRVAAVAPLLLALGAAASLGSVLGSGPAGADEVAPPQEVVAGHVLRPLPLAGRHVVVDPGHQLGNARFPAETARLVEAGGFRKACNTTGTATDAGYAEATFTWEVSRRLAERLRRAGARVTLTRVGDSADRWGPCVDERGTAGNAEGADLKVSVHGDGSYAAGAHGFHVIAGDEASLRVAEVLRGALEDAGFARATYVAGGDGLDLRTDLATLNLSQMPAVLVELGNMRDAGDAAVMTSPAGQERFASALASGVRRWLR
jgi:N-acetylmuramoyl-L-alanine amidase